MAEDKHSSPEEEQPPLPPMPVVDYGATAAPKTPSELALEPGEGMVWIRVPTGIMLTLDPTDPAKKALGGDRVNLLPGEYPVPERVADHWYVQAAGAKIVRRDAPLSSAPPEPAPPPKTPEAGPEVKPQEAPSGGEPRQARQQEAPRGGPQRR